MIRFFSYATLTILLFSLWAGIALLVINPYFHEDLPFYTLGRLCVWEFVIFLLCIFLAHSLIKRWGTPRIEEKNGKRLLLINPKYGYFFTIYLVIAVLVAIWQYWKFTQKFL